jgi:hypothetical protein
VEDGSSGRYALIDIKIAAFAETIPLDTNST